MKLKDLKVPDDVAPEVDDLDATNEVGLFYNKSKDVLIGDSTTEYVELARDMSPLAEKHIASDLWREIQNSKGQKAGGKVIQDRRKIVHAEWQAMADEIWFNGPALNKTDVALQIKVNIHCADKVGTISKVIKKPKRKYKNRKG